jgi:hypothetical protein
VFRLDARIASARQYGTTQRWSRAWNNWYPDADGIRYRSRHENEALNLCLFLDRCGDALTNGVNLRGLRSSSRANARPAQHWGGFPPPQ